MAFRQLFFVGLPLAALCGCTAPSAPAGLSPPSVFLPSSAPVENPVMVAPVPPEKVWNEVADVISDYFRIDREEPVHLVGNTLTEGRLETYPLPGATILEPWAGDSANTYERLESTLQSIRRRAVVRVIPSDGGYLIDVVVLKELEDCRRPEHATSGQATILYDDTLNRLVNPIGGEEITKGWIPMGRDAALEQRIVAELRSRLGTGAPLSPVGGGLPGSNCASPDGNCVQGGGGGPIGPDVPSGPSLGPPPGARP